MILEIYIQYIDAKLLSHTTTFLKAKKENRAKLSFAKV